MNKKIALLVSEGVDYKFLYEELKKVYPCVDLFKSEFSHLRKDIVTPVHKLIVRNLSLLLLGEQFLESLRLFLLQKKTMQENQYLLMV